MDKLRDFIYSSREFFVQGFRNMPIVLLATMLFIGTVQANFNYLFLLAGMFIIVPTVVFGLNIFTEFLFPLIAPSTSGFWKKFSPPTCNVLSIKEIATNIQYNVVPTYWTPIMSFFFTYLFLNGYRLYNFSLGDQALSNDAGEEARKTQALVSMILVVLIGVLFLLFRAATGCETALGWILGMLVGGSLAYGWHEFVKACGMGRLDDIFGITSRILPRLVNDQSQTVCTKI